MQPLKDIIWITPELNGLGGSEYLVTSACRLLSNYGINIHLITNTLHPSWKNALSRHTGTGTIQLWETLSTDSRDFITVIDSLAQSVSVSLLQIMPLETACFDIIRSRDYNFPICGLEPTDMSNRCWWLPDNLDQLIHLLDGLLILNPDAEQTASVQYQFRKPIQLIANTLITDLYRSSGRQYPVATFGCISRLSAEKGLDYLLGAFRLLAGRYPTASLNIWGEGEERERLINLSRMLGVDDQVRFHGAFHPFDDSLAISNSADIFILSSLFEGCPVSLLELADRGKPVLATATSGCKWLLGDNYPGLVPVADTTTLAQYMEKAMADPLFRDQLAGHAQQRVHSLFSPDITGQQLISFYTAIVNTYCKQQLHH